MNESSLQIEKTEELKTEEPKDVHVGRIHEQFKKFPYRFNVKKIGDDEFIVKNSCNNCYGTGIFGRVRANNVTNTPAYTVYCTCLTKLEENKDAEEE